MLVKYRILMSLVIMILLGSFFLIDGYKEKIEQATISHQQLSLLDAIEFFSSAEGRLEALKLTGNQQAWRHLAQLYAKENGSIAYQLAEYYLNAEQELPAQLWFQEAIRHQYQPARIALAKYYFNTQKYRESERLLLPVLESEAALILLYKLAIQQGDTAFISRYKDKLALIGNVDFYHELNDFSIFAPVKNKVNNQCDIDVQLFATNLAGLRHGEQLLSQFQQHKLSAYVCLQYPKYISAQQVNCKEDVTERISCDASVWGSRTDISSRYIGLIVEHGGANVDNGIMYIDQQDNIDVLAHELAHFVGFVDEYPLPSEHQKCHINQARPFSHNLVTLNEHYKGKKTELRKTILAQIPWASLIKDSTPILTEVGQRWQLATPKGFENDVGVFSAHSCDKNANVQAFKPYYQRTQLEYFELDFPQAYVDIMTLAPKRFLMPSYHYNVSRDLAAQGQYNKAKAILRVTLFR